LGKYLIASDRALKQISSLVTLQPVLLYFHALNALANVQFTHEILAILTQNNKPGCGLGCSVLTRYLGAKLWKMKKNWLDMIIISFGNLNKRAKLITNYFKARISVTINFFLLIGIG